MANPTLAQIRARVLDRADMTGSGFPVQARVDDYINAELGALWDEILDSNEDHAVNQTEISISSAEEAYYLPLTFYKARKVFFLSGGRRYKLKRFVLDDLDRGELDISPVGIHNKYLRYRIVGRQIWFTPKPLQTGTVELWWVPEWAPITSDQENDAINPVFPQGWEDYAVEGAAARLLEREETDATPFRTRQAQILQRILAKIEDRDIGEPHRMIDVQYRVNLWDDEF